MIESVNTKSFAKASSGFGELGYWDYSVNTVYDAYGSDSDEGDGSSTDSDAGTGSRS